jgi:UDPglucose 6-dehydrogenase
VKKVQKQLDGLEGKTIAAWGLAFKPNTDDVRDSPAVEIVRLLVEGGASVRVYDPEAIENARSILPDLVYAQSALEATEDADLLLILTDWDEIKMQDFNKVMELMKGKEILDTRNCLDPISMRRLGFSYQGVGR